MLIEIYNFIILILNWMVGNGEKGWRIIINVSGLCFEMYDKMFG